MAANCRYFLGAACLVYGVLALSSQGSALPISFGRNQSDVSYVQRKNDHFIVYDDERTPGQSALALEALETARPALERWFDVKRKSPLPVVTSSVTANASFANFIADALEVQTMGQGDRDLYWHEYVHSTMYRHMDNWLGPSGAILHLPWMPAWWIEGLAESLSVSVGSDVQASVERYQALSGDWPTYDRLHSLYAKYDFFVRGYATSGAFVRYIMAGHGERLPSMHRIFFKKSMPWYWPWAAVPFNNFMPMDAALKDYAGDNGKALYESYKSAATAYWKGHLPGEFLVARPGERSTFRSTATVHGRGDQVYMVFADGKGLVEKPLYIDRKTGWIMESQKEIGRRLEAETLASPRIMRGHFQIGVRVRSDAKRKDTSEIIYGSDGLQRVLAKDLGSVVHMAATVTDVWFLEQQLEATRLCRVNLTAEFQTPECVHEARLPITLELVGESLAAEGDDVTENLFISERTQYASGDRYRLLRFTPMTKEMATLPWSPSLRPITLADAGIGGLWMLTGERRERSLRRLDVSGICQGETRFADFLTGLTATRDGGLVLSLYKGSYGRELLLVPTRELRLAPCADRGGHRSPLLVAAGQSREITLDEAMKWSDPWSPNDQIDLPLAAAATQHASAVTAVATSTPTSTTGIAEEKPLGEKTTTQSPVESAQYRIRPMFLFPWIGADDALGSQIGFVTVPYTDDLQNDSARVSFLYGANSGFPNTEVNLITTRFWPTLSVTPFRAQSFNGVYYDSVNDELRSVYYDEKGVRSSAEASYQLWGGQVGLGVSVRNSFLAPYIGDIPVRSGRLNEVSASVSYSHSVAFIQSASWGVGLFGKIAPGSINEQFDYNQAGTNIQFTKSLSFLSSSFTLGAEGSRTRGPKMRLLREVYRPLRTFIPGSGGGYNQNSFALLGTGGLFYGHYGDNQARVKGSYTLPVFADLDKQLWIFYMERLDFTAFVNHGGAWRGADQPTDAQLVTAHGYNLDLQLENKGVRFNVGLGSGQVIHDSWQFYMTTGFDALF